MQLQKRPMLLAFSPLNGGLQHARRPLKAAFCAFHMVQNGPKTAPTRRFRGFRATISRVDLGRVGWLVTVIACLVAVLILLLEGYIGYAGVTLAVALSALVNLV